jgi:hypothetical protein
MTETNPKSEIRNPKQIQMTEARMTETRSPLRNSVLDFGFWSFVLVSDFVLRISDFLPRRRYG